MELSAPKSVLYGDQLPLGLEAKAQKKLYDILLKTAELRENILSSEEKFAIRNKLSKQGLESLKEDLQSEIFLIQKKADEAKLIVEKESKDLNELKKKFRAVQTRNPSTNDNRRGKNCKTYKIKDWFR